ncbi:MAG: hypothetical protein CW716_08710 [Candidatus Bathyarchaeum sp.]|nr:MAG: hypothetical protein CW716_08710 [Candidatus Bathyarchaeum sp.]
MTGLFSIVDPNEQPIVTGAGKSNAGKKERFLRKNRVFCRWLCAGNVRGEKVRGRAGKLPQVWKEFFRYQLVEWESIQDRKVRCYSRLAHWLLLSARTVEIRLRLMFQERKLFGAVFVRPAIRQASKMER